MPSPRPQFTLRALLAVMLVVAAFFSGAEFGPKQEHQRLQSERASLKAEAAEVKRSAAAVMAAHQALRDQERRVSSEQAKRAARLTELERRLRKKP